MSKISMKIRAISMVGGLFCILITPLVGAQATNNWDSVSNVMAVSLGGAGYSVAEPAAPNLKQGSQLNCSNASLDGKYVIGGLGNGFRVDNQGRRSSPFNIVTVGYINFNGHGGGTATITRNEDGQLKTLHEDVNYNLGSNCRGELTLTDLSNSDRERSYRIVAQGVDRPGGHGVAETINAVEVDPDTNEHFSGELSNDPRGGCTQATVAGRIAGGTGIGGTAGNLETANQVLTFNQDGTLSGELTLSNAGEIIQASITGTYQVKSDCSVSVSLLVDGNPTTGTAQLIFSRRGSARSNPSGQRTLINGMGYAPQGYSQQYHYNSYGNGHDPF